MGFFSRKTPKPPVPQPRPDWPWTLIRSGEPAANFSWDDIHLALDALSGEPASDLGLAMAMEYLCLQCGVEAEPVNSPAGPWLIVSTPQGYRHLLPQGLWPAEQEPGGGPPSPQKLLYTDQELIELGYTWPESLHPACEDYAAQGEEAR